MPTITSITPQKTFDKSRLGKKKVNIFLDGKFGFGLNLETFVKSKLKIYQELSEQDIERIVKEGEFQTTYDKILMYASLRQRSEKEFETWLVKHKVHPSLKEELFNRLKRLELLDDEKFAGWWIEQRLQFRPKPKNVLYQELKSKGIASETIKEVLEKTDLNEKIQIKNLLIKNERKWKGLNGYEKRRKIFTFLAGKGYGFESIKEVLDTDFED
jgi:regulatory protein